MFKITIICLGKLKEKAYQDLDKEFSKRLSPFAKLNLIELPEEPYKKSDDLEQIKLKEAEKIRNQIKSGAIVILLQEKGTLRSSVEFANFLDRLGSLGQEVVFVIGSGIGLHDSLKEVANYNMSLSLLTFPHNMARVLLLEQIYRAITIINGKEYHK